MERSASVANIKCVNSNLLGIYNFRLPQLGLIASDCERPVLAGLLNLTNDRLRSSLVSCQKLRLWNIQSEFE
jgi:hypothetical protein